jgi:hypothetical protein
MRKEEEKIGILGNKKINNNSLKIILNSIVIHYVISRD